MTSYFEAIPIELTTLIIYHDELSLTEFIEAYPQLDENLLRDYTRRYYPEIYKILNIISEDLNVTFKIILNETLGWIDFTGDYFEQSLHDAEEYHQIWLSETHTDIITADLTAIILLYKNYRKVYEYMVKNKVNKISEIYDDILKDYPNYPLIFIWVYGMLYLKDYKGMIISDNLDCNIIKNILKITDQEEYDL